MTRVPSERGYPNFPVLDVSAILPPPQKKRKMLLLGYLILKRKALFACGQGLIGKALDMRGHTKNVL